MRSVLCLYALVAAVICIGLGVHRATHAGDHAILQVYQNVDGIEVLHDFQIKDLESLGVSSFVTSTIWTDGEIEFHGVPVDQLLNHLNIKDGTLEIVAANDYFVEIPVEDLLEDTALVAFSMNRIAMSSRDKGPLWLVYPFDSDVKYQTETYYSRSIWQINRIRVLP